MTSAQLAELEKKAAASPCVQTSRFVSDSFETPWGTTARDVLNIALGSHRTPLTWQHDNRFSYSVEGTSTSLLVPITRRGPARFVERDGGIRCDRQPCAAYICLSELLIPVHVKAESRDGVIATEGDSQLKVSSQHCIGAAIGQSFATHPGAFRIREIHEKGLVVDGFGISFGFSRKRIMVGAVRGNYDVEYGAAYVEYACFPETPPPELRDSDEQDVGCRR